MGKFGFQYTREQRHLIIVTAENQEEAFRKAEAESEKLNLESPDDESDDRGELQTVDLLPREME